MRVVFLQAPGQPMVIREIPAPRPQAGEILIEIHYAALNHRDLWMQLGQYGGRKEELVMGSDGSGVVAAVGSGVDSKWLARQVLIHPGQHWGPDPKAQGREFTILGNPDQGCFAEYVCVKAENVYEKPSHLDLRQSAAFPLAGVTAYRALFTRAGIQAGQKILIRGIGAGTSLFALQFALAAGCRAWVTSGHDSKIEKAIRLGASGGVNYKNENWDKELKSMTVGFDIIIDSAAGPEFYKLVEICNPGGTIVNFGGTTGAITNLMAQRIYWKQLNILGSTMGNDQDFSKMLEFLNRHLLVPVIDMVFPMNEAESAFRRMEKAEQFGKILLEIRN